MRSPAALLAGAFFLRGAMPASTKLDSVKIAAKTARPTAPRALPLRCHLCGVVREAAPVSICGECLGPLDPVYDPTRSLPDRATIAARGPSLWRYREWLPFEGEPVYSLDSGFTPLLDAPKLARRLGVARAWVKNDTVSHPSLSFKDRVVAAAINAAAAFGLDTIGCASTGNLANAVAAHAARNGLKAWIFIPEDLEAGKVYGTSVYGPNLVRIRGTYDDVNRLCAQVADRFGWGIVNVNLRGYYGEGSKTVAYEIVEQLGWRLPTAVVAPMAGGSLVTKLRKGFGEFLDAGLVSGESPRLYGAQASGCAPIVRLVESGGTQIEPEVPHTIARSLAIGNPADGVFAAKAMRESGGWGAKVSDPELVDGIRYLAEDVGVFAETAGGVTVSAALALARAGRLRPDDEVVLCITGHGLKTLEAVSGVLPEAPVIAPRLREVAALVEQAGVGAGG
jgi:threonine synthase